MIDRGPFGRESWNMCEERKPDITQVGCNWKQLKGSQELGTKCTKGNRAPGKAERQETECSVVPETGPVARASAMDMPQVLIALLGENRPKNV